MIRRLREQHLRMVLVLAVLTPVLIVAAVLARNPVPRQTIPSALMEP